MTFTKGLALAWLFVFGSLCCFFGAQHARSVESHDLQHALQFGFDAFGRPCITLTLVAAYHSFEFLIPAAFFLILVACLLLFFRWTKGATFYFLFRSTLDTLASFPALLVALGLASILPNSQVAFLIACTLSFVPYLVRFFDGQISALRLLPHFENTIALGASPRHLYQYYVIPEMTTSIISILPFLLTRLILIETSLSFLGLPSLTNGDTWGRLLYQGKEYLLEAPWIMAMVSLPLFLTLLSFHVLSDRD